MMVPLWSAGCRRSLRPALRANLFFVKSRDYNYLAAVLSSAKALSERSSRVVARDERRRGPAPRKKSSRWLAIGYVKGGRTSRGGAWREEPVLAAPLTGSLERAVHRVDPAAFGEDRRMAFAERARPEALRSAWRPARGEAGRLRHEVAARAAPLQPVGGGGPARRHRRAEHGRGSRGSQDHAARDGRVADGPCHRHRIT
jgi:hypothetical protein